MVGSLVDGAAAVSVAVGLGTLAPLVSVFVPAVLLSLSFFVTRLKIALSLSIASSAVVKKWILEI